MTCVYSRSSAKKHYGQWTISTAPGQDIPWANFTWVSDSFGNKYFDRSAMYIPATIQGLPYNFIFQFDLGSDITRIYEKNARSITAKHPAFNFKKLSIHFGPFTIANKNCYIEPGYGDQLNPDTIHKNTALHIATIGSDVFQNKILIIDYPNKRFSILDTLPAIFQKIVMTSISLDKNGRVLLPMQYKGENFKVLFDNGSSVFPLLTSPSHISIFSSGRDVDTIQVPAWGEMHNITAKPLKDTIIIANRKIADILVYTDQNSKESSAQYDAITGNALFWNQVIILDFKNKRFGTFTP